MKELKIAILKTLCYADIFDFPLKKEEILEYLIGSSKLKVKSEKLCRRKSRAPKSLDESRLSRIRRTCTTKASAQLKTQKLIKIGKIEEKIGLYFLQGREKIVDLRKKREKESKKKLEIAKRTAGFLKIISTIKMVAVTGALAVNNSKKGDDIDFLIVSEKNRLWTTRFLATILMEIFSRRRRPRDKNIADKICLNMFLDEEQLTVPQKEQDLFTAHEVIQLKPLWEKDNIYQKFLVANKWVERFLPNTVKKLKTQDSKLKIIPTKSRISDGVSILSTRRESSDLDKVGTAKNSKVQDKKLLALSRSFTLYTLHFSLVENVLKHFQLWYMRRRRTTEVISNGIIRFHPQDARVWVLKEYQKRIKDYDMI